MTQCALSCTTEHFIDCRDVNLDPPASVQLEIWNRELREGAAWRADARQVAHRAILNALKVAWAGETYRESEYEFKNDRAEWGPYVVRGYVDRSGRLTRYRVRLQRSGDVWYPVQVSHYLRVELPHPALED